MVYSDLNGNGIIETPSEILDEVHYYPNGLKMEGYWMNSDKFRYTFNSIEEIDDFGLNVNRATFRTLDPELGRWWSVDPKATVLMGLSPYNSMNNSPMVFNDPNGDLAPLIAIGAAVIGGGINVATHWDDIMQGGFNLGTAATAFGIGAVGGLASAYTGGAVSGALGLGSTGALAGLVGGITGEAVGGPVTGGLNAAAFGDSYTQADWVQGMIWGGVFGAGLGAWDAARKGLDPWLGDFTPGGNGPKLTTGSSGVGDVATGPYKGPNHMWSGDNLGSIYNAGDNAGPQVVVRASGSGGGGGTGYRSFSALKRALGPAGKGRAWHHIVEQGGNNVANFGADVIHNTNNIVNLPHGKGTIHAKISGYYSSKLPGTNMLVREYVRTLSYSGQRQFGIDVLRRFGYTGLIP